MSLPLKAFWDWEKRRRRSWVSCRINHDTGRIESRDGALSWTQVEGVIEDLSLYYQHWGAGNEPIHEGVFPCVPDCPKCILVGRLQLLTVDGLLVLWLRYTSLRNLFEFLKKHCNLSEDFSAGNPSLKGIRVRINCVQDDRFCILQFYPLSEDDLLKGLAQNNLPNIDQINQQLQEAAEDDLSEAPF